MNFDFQLNSKFFEVKAHIEKRVELILYFSAIHTLTHRSHQMQPDGNRYSMIPDKSVFTSPKASTAAADESISLPRSFYRDQFVVIRF